MVMTKNWIMTSQCLQSDASDNDTASASSSSGNDLLDPSSLNEGALTKDGDEGDPDHWQRQQREEREKRRVRRSGDVFGSGGTSTPCPCPPPPGTTSSLLRAQMPRTV